MLLLLSSKGQGLESSGRTDIYRVGLLLKTTYEEIFLVSHIGILACKKVSQFQLDDFKLFQCRIGQDLSGILCISAIRFVGANCT